MGDSRRIDHLRALALSSMPSLARRPSLALEVCRRRNSGTVDALEQRRTVVSASPRIQDEKEEGELSSDDEPERTATPPAAVESSFSFAHRNAGQSLRAPIQGKDKWHTSAASSAEFGPLVGVSSASVFSTSTRVSIVNKSQLYSAFTAQAPPLIHSQIPEPVQNGSGVGIIERQPKHSLPEATSSGSCVPNLHRGSLEISLRPSSAATSPSLCRPQESGKARIGETVTQNSSIGGSTGSQIHDPVPLSTLASLKFPDPSTAVPAVTRGVSPLPFSVTAIGVPESIGATSGQALVVTGADLSTALGTPPATSVFATPVLGNAGARKEAGVRKEAEAFLASLRIPLATSIASGDENEDSFLIKFDDDSDSDGDNDNRTNPTRRHPDRRSRKGTTSSAGHVTISVAPQSNSAIPSQSPADLTAEIDRMREKIAAMERTKGKTSMPSVPGKAGRALSTDTQRNMLLPATEPRPGNFLAVNVRPASSDLESMRLRIAAKENELQQRRQRLAVKVPEGGRGVSDPKRAGGVLASSLPSTTRFSQAADSAAAYAGNPIGKSSSEKGISGCKKDVQARADGIPALALAGPAGANLAAFKKDADQRGLDGCNDHQHSNGPVSNFAAVQVGSHVGRVTGQQQSVPKVMKRLRAEEEIGELAKVPRLDNNSVSEKNSTEDSLKETALRGNMNDTLKGGRSSSSVQGAKRRVDAGQMSSHKAVPGSLLDNVSAVGPAAMKKLKTNLGEAHTDAHIEVQHGARSMTAHDVLLSTLLPRETRNLTLKTTTGAIPGMGAGKVVILDVEPAPSLSAPLPFGTVQQRNSQDVQPSLNVSKKLSTNGNAEAPMVKERDIEQTAISTTVAVTDCPPETLGRLNSSASFAFENNRVHTTQPSNLVNPVASMHLENKVERSSHPGLSRIDDQQLFEEHVTFQQLLEEEELLDKQLEEVQRIRQHCEVRERVARREYREAQWALRAANEDCFALNQRKESLLSRIHAAEATHLPVKSSIDRPLVPFGGTVVTHIQNRPPERPPLLVSAPYPLPVSQAPEGSWDEDVNADRGRSAIARDSLSPFSSNRVDVAAIAHTDAKTVVSAEDGEENSGYKLDKSVSSDDKEHESFGLLIAGVESSGRLENQSPVPERKEQTGFVHVERQDEALESGTFVDGASQAGNQCFTRCESDLNHNESPIAPSAGVDSSGPRVSEFSEEGQTNAVSRDDDLPQESLLEESELPMKNLPIIIECSGKTVTPCSVDDITGIRSEDDGHLVPGQGQVPALDLPQVMGKDLEQEDNDKENHDAKRLTASSSSQDAQSVDSLRSAPDLVPDLDSNCVHESVNMEDLNLSMDDALQDDLMTNVSHETHEDDVVRKHIKGCSIGTLAIEFSDADYRVKAGAQYELNSLSTECARQVLPERSFSVQEMVFLESEAKAVESCAGSRGYAEDVPFDPEGEAIPCCPSHNLEGVNEASDGTERNNVDSLVEVPHVSVRFTTEPQQCPTHLPSLSILALDKEEANPYNDDLTPMKNCDVALSNVEQEAPIVLGNSSSDEAQPIEPKAELIDEPSGQRLSATFRHSDGATDDPIALDLEMQHVKDVESQGVPRVDPGGEVERPDGANDEEHSLAPEPASCRSSLQEELDDGASKEEPEPGRYFSNLQEELDDGVSKEEPEPGSYFSNLQEELDDGVSKEGPEPASYFSNLQEELDDGVSKEGPGPGSHFSSLQEELDDGVSREDRVGTPAAESTDFISDVCYTEQSPAIIDHGDHDTLILEKQSSQPPSEQRDPCDSSFVTQFAGSVNLHKTGLQDFADILEEQHHETCEVPQEPSFELSFDNNSTIQSLDARKQDPVQDGDADLGRIIDSDMISDNSDSRIQNEFGSQAHYAAIAVVAEDEQRDELGVIMSESGEQKHEGSEKKESKGAEVEVFRKALLDGKMFEKRSSSGEVADSTNLRNQNTDEVSTQILPQLQHHRLEHLLDMVEVRVPELSTGGDALVQEVLPGVKDAKSPMAVDDLQLDTSTPESHDVLVQSGEQALSTRAVLDNVSDTAERWVPSADSLAVLRFITRDVVPPSASDTGREMERVPSETDLKAFYGTSVAPTCNRYESPLSIFRSYRISPQFSDDFHLSRGSLTWSHAINPFKPLCKFEHRGKCNNDDCPWQHADDYTMSPSQIMSQIQNYVDPRGLTSDDHDQAGTFMDKDEELAVASASSTIGDSPVTAAMAKAPLAGPREILPGSFMGPVFSPLKWDDVEIPIYCTGSYTLRMEDPMRMFLHSQNLQPERKGGNLHSFLLSPSIHRPLPPDIPCLLDASETPSWYLEAPAYHPGSPHWRYIRDIQEKLISTKDGGELQELIDEEMWLELALHHIDYDIRTDNSKARDQALFYLSRALESKQSSVTLWVVYSCLFHTRKDNHEKDDMFHHAVQYNPSSYELWILFINSRCDFKSRLEAHEKAIVALADKGTQLLLDPQDLSAYILDIGLQMLYFWCVSGHSEDSFSWVDDLICEASAKDDEVRPRRGSTRVLLSHLTKHDACVLWIACTYLLACKHLPTTIITRLGCRKELPDGLEWEKYAKRDEATHVWVMKALSTASSEGLGCLSLGSVQAVAERDDCPRQVLGVNYVQCLSLYEGLESAACLGKKLISLHPTSLELIVLCARIDEHRKGFTTGLRIFEEAVSHWPHDLPGMQRLWNQYAGHSLQWGGKDLAKSVLSNCAAAKNLPTKTPVSVVGSDKTQRADRENTDGGWNHVREYFVKLTSVGKRSDVGAISSHQLLEVEDAVFALINLALVEALSGDIAASQSAINSAMKAAVSHKDLRHCWRELAAFQQVFSAKSSGWGSGQMLDNGILSLLDRCKTDSYNLSQLRPLSEKSFQNYKKPHVRKFLEYLIGPPPLDYSVLNSILGTLYGAQLLPSSDSYPLKEVFHFAEGILEVSPGNVQLASSLCKIVCQSRSTLRRMYLSAVMWASALLTSSLHQSCPVAPEAYWLEAGSLLRQLEEERSLEEFYKLALVKYPFSAALRRCLQEVQDRLQVSLPRVVEHERLQLVSAEPMQVAVEC